MLFRPSLHDLITKTTHHDQRRNQGECFGHKKIMTFCSYFRVIYNWNFNWWLHPLNERAIGATMLQMIDRDINFHILQKKSRSQVYLWRRLWVAISIFRDMAAMTAEQWEQFYQLVAKTVDTAGDHRYWLNAVKRVSCGSSKDDCYQSATYLRTSWCNSSLQGFLHQYFLLRLVPKPEVK